MTEKITITEKDLEDAIYEHYKSYREWYNLTHSERLLIENFADHQIDRGWGNLFYHLKKVIQDG